MTANDTLLNPTILDILSKEPSWTPLAESLTRKGCHYQNFHLNHQYIIKLFRFRSDKPPIAPWWDKEHQALHLLDGKLGSPISHGYAKFNHDGFTTVYLFKEMVSGKTLVDLGQVIIEKEQCAKAGELLADIHNHKIVTGDCHLDNILIKDDNTYCFIDFGNASIYPRASFMYGLIASRDLQKAKQRCANLDPELSQLIENAYLSRLHNKPNSILHCIVRSLARLHQKIRLYRGKEIIKTPSQLETKKKYQAQKINQA